MADEQEVAIQVDIPAEVRSGVHADFSLIATKSGVTRLDFILFDGIDSPSGVLASRVFMANEDIVALRDALIRHTENWVVQEVTPDAE